MEYCNSVPVTEAVGREHIVTCHDVDNPDVFAGRGNQIGSLT